ncbi:hypothetical protein EC988_001721 [Linderina pennispora]|nr:hypothetical protein EC988_001721 [Linderina pennispora]
MNEYFSAMQLASINYTWRYCFPDFACQYLVLHRQVSGACEKKGVRSFHKGHWLSNYRFLSSMSKLHHVIEFRVAMLDECRHSLMLAQAIRCAGIGACQMPNVRSLVFIGGGIFTSSMYIYRRDRMKIDKDAVSLLQRIFPSFTSMRYSLADSSFPTAGLPAYPNSESSRFYEMLLASRLCSLRMAQAFNPVPVNTTIQFSHHLTHLQMNAELVANSQAFGLLPVDQLRRLEMVNIDGVAPWNKFERSGNTVKFPNVECLVMRFRRTMHLRLKFPGYNLRLQFPSLQFLTICDAGYAYRDLYTFFSQYQLASVDISEHLDHYEMIDPSIFENSKVLKMMCLMPKTKGGTRLSSSMFHAMFSQCATTEKMSLAGLYYPNPRLVLWTMLLSLDISICIADYQSLVSLISQLPFLKELCMCCFSMDRRDAVLTIYTDLDATFAYNDIMHRPEDRSAVNFNLRRLEINAAQALNKIAILALACRLPALCQLGVNKEHVDGLHSMVRAANWLKDRIFVHKFQPLS